MSHHKRYSGLSLVAGFTAALVSNGCSSSDAEEGPALVAVSGVVTFDGIPVTNANITFIPLGETKGRPSYASTDMTGVYAITSANQKPGTATGTYKVVISKFAKVDGTAFPPDADGAMAAAEGMEHLPRKYSDADRTTLTASVPESGATIDFALNSKRR